MQPPITATPHTWEMTACGKAVAVHPMGVFGGLLLVAPGKALGGVAPWLSATGTRRERVELHWLSLCLCLVIPDITQAYPGFLPAKVFVVISPSLLLRRDPPEA